MKVYRKIIEIDEERCNGCGQCVLACAEGTLELIDGKARVISDNLCDGLGACIGECPMDALKIIEREAEEFDEEAVEKRLSEMEKAPPAVSEGIMACGCPSSQIMRLKKDAPAGPAAPPPPGSAAASELSHWPVKIRLVPPTAPFLKGADVLVLADCAATAYPDLHRSLIRGRVVMMGCPKFDDTDLYLQKLTDICRQGGINSLTTAIMEVPCCSGLHTVVRKAREASGATVPLTELVIGRNGDIISRTSVGQETETA